MNFINWVVINAIKHISKILVAINLMYFAGINKAIKHCR